MAWNMAHAMDKEGHQIDQIISPNEEHAKALASKFGAFYGTQLSQINERVDLIIISIKDDHYQEVLSRLNLPASLTLCHTSGPFAMEGLKESAFHYGVLYPLQSFTKRQLKDFREVPLLIEASDAQAERTLMNMAQSLSNSVSLKSSEQRKHYHLAAVFANNFSNLMYSSAQRYLEGKNLEFDLLKPIIYETALRLRGEMPLDVQTGPARRKDQKVIQDHINMIDDPQLKEIYAQLSKVIMTLY